ncbi:MAG: nucleotidyltransferase family protein [Methanobacteriota archaeon]
MNGKSKALFGRIAEFLAKRGASRVSVFGSYAREDEHEGSDIDLMVEFSDRKSLLDLVGIELELSESIGRDVDLVTEKSLSPFLRERVMKERVVIYPA